MKKKSIIKEIFIFLLVLVAVALVLAILLYSYSPSGKIVPNKVAYETPEDIKGEISSTDIETTTPVVVSYELNETQISNSKKAGSYVSGKQNPFASPNKQTTESTEEGNNSTNDNSNNQNTSDNSNNTSSGNNSSNTNETQYLPNNGTK